MIRNFRCEQNFNEEMTHICWHLSENTQNFIKKTIFFRIRTKFIAHNTQYDLIFV